MYTDADLNHAVKRGVLTAEAVEHFRALHRRKKNTATNEEHFRFVTGFNDVFVVAVSLLLLFSGKVLLTAQFGAEAGFLAMVLLSWALAEYFVLKQKMALSAITLLLSYTGGVFMLALLLLQSVLDVATENDAIVPLCEGMPCFFILDDELPAHAMLPTAVITIAAAAVHWCRFKVPMTVAAIAAAMLLFLWAAVVTIFPESETILLFFMFVGGLAVFAAAMYWDSSDLQRTTRHADIAFWLHLLSAPVVAHPVFSKLIEWLEAGGGAGYISVIALYVLMVYVSLVVDRRALMLSSLFYLQVALSNFLEKYGKLDDSDSFAIIGVLVGIVLLLLSVFWHPARRRVLLLNVTPAFIQRYVPVAKPG